ncbi:MAG: elongation factor P--(R)-beta-lysine ligase [Spirochaetales bacterium]|nr:elongation factor P--(R)-beta-lysine ligase [Spirochaetales bacterium]
MFDFSAQKSRSILFRNIRDFFDSRGYLEVFTPTLSDTLIPEPTIQNFKTDFINEFVGGKELYLIPSPEIFMKTLLANGSGSIYEISQCFRNSEQLGDVHNPEFTMLEYYTVDFDEEDSIALTEELIRETALPETPEHVLPPFIRMSVNEAMKRYAGVDLEKCQNPALLREKAERLGLYVPEHEAWDDTFNRIFINFVETNLPTDHPVVLTDYPYQIDCLAKRRKGTPYRQRWEMYIAGCEVANCYAEETDKETTRLYYEKEYQRLVSERADTGLPIPDISTTFPELDIPPSSGVAIGLDRLLMVMLGKKEIAPLLLFPLSDMM